MLYVLFARSDALISNYFEDLFIFATSSVNKDEYIADCGQEYIVIFLFG